MSICEYTIDSGELVIGHTEPSVGTQTCHDPVGRWMATDLHDFLETDIRGEDTEISGYDGAIPFQHRFATTRYLLPFSFSGWIDASGDCPANPLAQLWTNIAAFKALCVGPDGTDGDRAVTYTPPGGGTWSSRMQVLMIRKDEAVDGVWVGNLEVVLLKPWTVT